MATQCFVPESADVELAAANDGTQQVLVVPVEQSVDQCEYATDIVFRRQADLQAICENPARTAILPSSRTMSPPSSAAN